MSRFLWFFAWAAVILWSILCMAAYGFLSLTGGWLARNADVFSSDPETVEAIFRAFSGLQSLSTGAVLVGWGVVSLLLLGVPWAITRMIGRAVVTTGSATGGFPPGYGGPSPTGGYAPGGFAPPTPGRRDGVIDLGPDQYSVRPGSSSGAPSSPTPRIPPRG